MRHYFVKIRAATQERLRNLQSVYDLDVFRQTARNPSPGTFEIQGLLSDEEIERIRTDGYEVELVTDAERQAKERLKEVSSRPSKRTKREGKRNGIKTFKRRNHAMAHKALLVGINDYAPVGPGGPDLRGCVNDVRDMAHTLNALGIVPASPGSVRILTDARATKANIAEGLKWLTKGAKKGDVLVFYYSGHGSQIADLSGEEIDGKDETICPHDFAAAGMIKDDDLRTAFAGLPAGVNLEVLLDSCHSGTGTREAAALAAAPEDQAVTYRYIEPPLDYGFFLDSGPAIPVKGILKPSNGGKEVVAAPGLNHVLWTGCRDYQTSAEAPVEGAYRGIFTYCFCKALRRAGVGITRRKLDALVSADVRRMGHSQVPQLEGARASIEEKVFT